MPDSFLEGIASRYEGKEICLNDIDAIVKEVDREYKDRGYFAAKAYVPNQDARDHILKINLIEGKIDRIAVKENKSTSENFVRRNLGVESGDRLSVKELQDNILMFNAANDVKARIAMEPGEKFATTDLDVIVEEPQRVSVSAFADNAGQKSTGVYRTGALAFVRSLTGYRDNLNFGGVVTEGSNAFFGSFDIPEPVFDSRIGFGADYSDTEIVGGDLKALDVTGNFYNYYFYIKRPVYVTDSFVNNLNFTANFKNGASYIGNFRTQKVYTDTLSLSWDSLKLFAGGYLYNQQSVAKGARLFDGTRSFWRFNYNGEFQQSFLDDFALNVKAKAQYTEQDFLPSSEQFQIGGNDGVISGAEAISGTKNDAETKVTIGTDTVFSRNVARKEKEKDYQFAVSALDDVKATDKAKLVSGGALAIADTVSLIDNRKNKAAVNLKGSIVSIDDLVLTANSNANLNSEVYVNTYGASGVAMGNSTVRTTSDNSVNFADGSRTMSYGDLQVYAGQAYEDYSGNNTLHSRVYLWNNTALPFSDPEVEAAIAMNNLINIDSGAVVKSGLGRRCLRQ